MPDGPRHEIADLRRAPGELSFEARIEGSEPMRVSFRTPTDVTPAAEAALATCLMPAMASGGRLPMSEPVSPRILRSQRDFQAIQRAWSRRWPFQDSPLEQVEVVGSGSRGATPPQPSGSPPSSAAGSTPGQPCSTTRT